MVNFSLQRYPFGALILPPPSSALLGNLLERLRTRQSWNDRFTHWEKPASLSEAATIERAQFHVETALGKNTWLTSESVTVQPQGSYHNNTNVRTEADIDLRVVHPAIFVSYDTNVVQNWAWQALGYRSVSFTRDQIASYLRAVLLAELRAKFGNASVTAGNKAIRITGITGSRAEIDVVPCIRFQHVSWQQNVLCYHTLEGVAIFSESGKWTFNFPEQHTLNGRSKRERTAHRFKKMVRIFKRLRADMESYGVQVAKIPSFLVECLVYGVGDEHFLVDGDDRYDRVCRIARQMHSMVNSPFLTPFMTEINGIKLLFGTHQSWTEQDARAFITAAMMHLGCA